MGSNRQRYYLQIDDLTLARGEDASMSFDGATVEGLVETVRTALSESALFERWRLAQEDPDEVDPQMGLLDAQAQVIARTVRSRVDMTITTSLPHALIKHRLHLLIGEHWRLHDVKAA